MILFYLFDLFILELKNILYLIIYNKYFISYYIDVFYAISHFKCIKSTSIFSSVRQVIQIVPKSHKLKKKSRNRIFKNVILMSLISIIYIVDFFFWNSNIPNPIPQRNSVFATIIREWKQSYHYIPALLSVCLLILFLSGKAEAMKLELISYNKIHIFIVV